MPTTRPLLASLATLTAGLTIAPHATAADRVQPPPVPAEIAVPPGNVAFLATHATGTQNYLCLPSGSAFAWSLVGPQATLTGRHERQVMTHFLSPNPDENGTPRATWQHSRDTSAVWAKATASSSDPAFVEPGAIPWLRLEAVGADDGSARRGELADTTYLQRVNTAGGVAPGGGCAVATDVGARAFVPYEADYVLFHADHH